MPDKTAIRGNMRVPYQTTKTVTGKSGKPKVPVKGKEGKSVIKEEVQSERWKEQFDSLLNSKQPQPSK